MTLDAFLAKHRLDDGFRETAQKWFDPLADALVSHYKGANKPLYIGVNGCQGSGKSTLADYLSFILTTQHGLSVIVCSLDDFYLPSAKRQALAKTVHPLFATRGVPGTHDVELLEQVLLHCQQTATMAPLALPRFDKASDEPAPRESWPMITLPVDVVLFEGWCWGVRAQDDDALTEPVNALEAQQDPDAIWRRYVNTQLQHHYEPLYALMDTWIMLQAPDFATVSSWREEQESKLRATVKADTSARANKVMTKAEVQGFIQYFQRLTEHALKTLPSQCNWVVKLDDSRQISGMTGPTSGYTK